MVASRIFPELNRQAEDHALEIYIQEIENGKPFSLGCSVIAMASVAMCP